MAIIVEVSNLSKTETSLTMQATYQSGGTTTRKVQWYLNGSWVSDATSTFTATTSHVDEYVFSGLSSGTSYQISAEFFDPNGNMVGSDSAYFSTDSPPEPEPETQTSVPPNLSVSASSSSQLYINWGSVTGADRYDVRMTSPYTETRDTTSSYLYWGGLDPDTTYTFQVRAYDSAQDVAYSSWSGYESGTTDSATQTATPTNFNGTAENALEIFYDWDGVTGADSYEVSIYNPIDAQKTATNSYLYWGNLSPDTIYYAQVRAYDASKDIPWSEWSNYDTTRTPLQRPSDWDWGTVGSGYDFNITAAKWNNFTTRINDFRSYKGLADYSFTTAYSGNSLTASMFNEARNAVSSMNPSISIPPYVYSGDDCTAYIFNRIEDALNSIS